MGAGTDANEITDLATLVGTTWSDPAYDDAGNMTTITKMSPTTSTHSARYDA